MTGPQNKSEPLSDPPAKVILVGNPNVGKSVIFNYLTGAYRVVSNYPGTTVEVSSGSCGYKDHQFTILDTPGINNLLPIQKMKRLPGISCWRKKTIPCYPCWMPKI